jgi:hypothetical protein
MSNNHFFVIPSFYKNYRQLRGEFEGYFKDPKATHQKRFVWDFWYDEDQYHLIRTPAFYYFQKKRYQEFHSHLVQWGRENLGCHDISPPWLSYYVDGCYQNLHSDVPHGPWAFVYSLTPNEKEFRGGETLILKPKTLDYWTDFNETKEYEYSSFVDRIPSKMNQLVIFDPRFPHGVTEVKGTRDPLKGRLVVHGWFVNPRPYVVGGLSTAQVQRALNPAFEALMGLLSQVELVNGTVSIRLKVNRAGAVTNFVLLTNTLIAAQGQNTDQVLLGELKKILRATRFPKSKSDSAITIPLLFKT